MAITILDVNSTNAFYGGKNPQLMFDFNAPQALNNDQKRHRVVTGRIKAYDGDTIKAGDIGLRTIRSIVFTPVTAMQVGGSLSKLGSQNNSVTIDLAQKGTTTATASFTFLTYFAAGDR